MKTNRDRIYDLSIRVAYLEGMVGEMVHQKIGIYPEFDREKRLKHDPMMPQNRA